MSTEAQRLAINETARKLGFLCVHILEDVGVQCFNDDYIACVPMTVALDPSKLAERLRSLSSPNIRRSSTGELFADERKRLGSPRNHYPGCGLPNDILCAEEGFE